VCFYFSLHFTLTGTGVAAIVRSLMTIRRLIKTIIRLIKMMVAVPARANMVFSISYVRITSAPPGWEALVFVTGVL
jgi:hypothetical protein